MELKVISGAMHPKLTDRICASLGIEPTKALVGHHADGDDEVQILESLRGADVFIIQSFAKPLWFWLGQLLVMIDAVRRASADRVTAVIPYFGGRQDRKAKPRQPITARLVADMIVASGVDRVMLLDAHALQEEGFFPNRVPVDHLQAHPLVAAHLKTNGYGRGDVFGGPDGNATTRYAKPLVEVFLGSSLASLQKLRRADSKVETLFLLGDVKHKRVILVDDMVTTGGTTLNAVQEFSEAGARSVEVIVTHPVMVGEAYVTLANPLIEKLIVTNSLPTSVEGMRCLGSKVTILDIAPLLAKAVQHVHTNESVGPLLAVGYWDNPLSVLPEENDSPAFAFWEATASHLPRLELGRKR